MKAGASAAAKAEKAAKQAQKEAEAEARRQKSEALRDERAERARRNDSVLGRLPLFDITLVSAPVVRGLHARAGSVQLDNVRLTLNDEAAVALDAVFNVSAFQAGLPVGTARVQTYFYEPAP